MIQLSLLGVSEAELINPLSCSLGGISVVENSKTFRSSNVCVSGSRSSVVTPLGCRIRTYIALRVSFGLTEWLCTHCDHRDCRLCRSQDPEFRPDGLDWAEGIREPLVLEGSTTLSGQRNSCYVAMNRPMAASASGDSGDFLESSILKDGIWKIGRQPASYMQPSQVK